MLSYQLKRRRPPFGTQCKLVMWYIMNIIKQLCMPMNKPGWSEYQNLSVLQRVQWLSYIRCIFSFVSNCMGWLFGGEGNGGNTTDITNCETRVFCHIMSWYQIWKSETKLCKFQDGRITLNPYIAASTLRRVCQWTLYVLLNRGPSFPVSALQELWCCKCDDLEAGTRCHIFHLGNI